MTGKARNGRILQPNETPDLCRICESSEGSQALAPLPICARCAYLIHDVIELAHSRPPGPLPSQVTAYQRAAKHDSRVYYVRRGDLIKIGYTADLRRRMAAIRPDEVLAIEPGDFVTECSRHAQFRHLRVSGEWFRDCDELREHVARIVVAHGPPPSLPLMPVANAD